MIRIRKLSQITEQLPYPAFCKGELMKRHSDIVTAVMKLSSISRDEARRIISIINTVSYRSYLGESYDWDSDDPLAFSDILEDDDELQDVLSELYVPFRFIQWELDGIELTSSTTKKSSNTPKVSSETTKPVKSVRKQAPVESSSSPRFLDVTDKSDLYIQSPVVPRFDSSRKYLDEVIDGIHYTIYYSLPDIPKKQNQISITTDVYKMTSRDLLSLYPTYTIRTRASCMYEPVQGIVNHPILGNILPIEGYTEEELVDNIVRYPHLFRLIKEVDGNRSSFYTTIELDGELHRISDVWMLLPESRTIPYTSDFVKEYVVRRYLLERDIKKIVHNYPMLGRLDEFLTLFASKEDYLSLGYTDLEEIARKCVLARVAYKQSRNPILRRLNNA